MTVLTDVMKKGYSEEETFALKDAVSMPARTRPWQKAIEFVDGLKEKLPDEELAVIKQYAKK